MKRCDYLHCYSRLGNKLIAAIAAVFFATSLLGVSLSAGDKVVVTGVVTSFTTGEPLAGVAVYIAGTTHSDFTDAQGRFSLSFPPKKGVKISFQFLGMLSEDIAYTGQKTINLEMRDDAQKLEDVVVTGYGNIRKSGFTGNTTKVTKEELVKVSPKNVISSIQVFDPSFRIAENINMGSNPNALPEFYVRGRTSVKMDLSNSADISRQNLTQNNNLPIFILDGFEVGVEKIYDMDPARINSMTLLKDAAATALYGSRAANGVVVIETRAPEEGRLRVRYNLTSSLEVPDLSDYNLMNAKEKVDAEFAAGFFKNDAPAESGLVDQLYDYAFYIKKLNNIANGVETDWMAQAVRTAFHHKHLVSIDGGSRDMRWAAEIKYNGVDGVLKGTDRKTYGAGLTLDYRIGKLQILDRVDFDAMASNEMPNQNFSTYVHLQPYDIFEDPKTGKYIKELEKWGLSGDPKINPLYEAEYMNSFNRNSYNDFSNKLLLNFFVTEALTLKSSLSINKKFNNSKKFIDPSSTAFIKTTDPSLMGSLNTGEGDYFSYNFNAMAMFNKTIGKNYINSTALVELLENQYQSVDAKYTGFPSGGANSVNNAMRIDGKPVRSSNKTRLASFMMMANYSYADIYLFDVSVRFDGSSEFGKKQKTAPFWAGGLGLNVHNYDFLKGNKYLSMLKLRATYGQLGKVNFPVYAAKSSYVSTSTKSWYLTGIGNMMRYLGNDKLTWEKTNSLDLGFDLGLFDDRVVLRATYYDKQTMDMITSVTLPSSSGFTSYMDNIGRVQNRGWEIDLRYNIFRTRDFDLTLFGNMSHNKNKILEISDALKAYNKLVEKQYEDYNKKATEKHIIAHTKFVEGGSTTSIFAMRSLGINPANGKEVYLRPNGDITYDWNAADMVIVGDTEPLARGSFGFNARWKNFSVFTSFMYHFGGQQYNYTLVRYVEDVNLLLTNADRRVGLYRWKKPGDVSSFKDISSKGYVTRPTSRFVQSDNVLQFNSLSLSYDFSPSALRQAKISMLRLTASMEDLGYWSTIRRERGIFYPYSRTFNFSVNLTF